jgi:hypothetical protein
LFLPAVYGVDSWLWSDDNPILIGIDVLARRPQLCHFSVADGTANLQLRSADFGDSAFQRNSHFALAITGRFVA